MREVAGDIIPLRFLQMLLTMLPLHRLRNCAIKSFALEVELD